jgi:hypothetical protein
MHFIVLHAIHGYDCSPFGYLIDSGQHLLVMDPPRVLHGALVSEDLVCEDEVAGLVKDVVGDLVVAVVEIDHGFIIDVAEDGSDGDDSNDVDIDVDPLTDFICHVFP